MIEPRQRLDGAREAKRQVALPPFTRAFEFWWRKYLRTWRGSLTSSFLYPTLYLAAMGVGLGGLIDHHLGGSGSSGLGTSSYLAFVAPGVLAGSAMQIGVYESSYPVMGAMKWNRAYLAQVLSPLSATDVLLGHVCFMGARLFGTCAIFTMVMVGFGATHSGETALAVIAAMLTGFAFALPVAAFSSRQDNDAGLNSLYRLIIVPLFLFSGSFFPVHQLPGFLQAAAQFTPLYHGVALCRACTLGHLWQWSSLGHLAYLLVLSALGLLLARASYIKRLLP